MPQEIEGVFKNGKVELSKAPAGVPNDTRVIVTFPDNGTIDLESVGIDREQAADLRGRLNRFAEDWESPEMSVYDDYDSAKT